VLSGGTSHASSPTGPTTPPISQVQLRLGEASGQRKWGAAVGVDIDRDGKSVWVFDRCEDARSCSNSNLDPIMKFDATGKLVKSFGAGMISFSHGLHVDPTTTSGSPTPARKAASRATSHEVQSGRQAPDDARQGRRRRQHAGHVQRASDILVAPNGDIFVADGHGGDTNARA